MSKKTTRKGIALATGLAFSLSGLTSAPALAAGDITLATIEPDDGKSLVGTLNYTFDLNSYFEFDNDYTTEQMIKIENPAGAEIYIEDGDDYDSEDDVYVMKNGSLVQATEEDWDGDTYYYDDTVLYIETDDYYSNVYLGTTEESGSVSLKITSWGDYNSDGIIGDVEKTYGVATADLKFIDPSTLTPIPSIDEEGLDTDESGFSAYVGFSQDVNVNYLDKGDWYLSLESGSTSIDQNDGDASTGDLRSSTVYLEGYDSDWEDENLITYYVTNADSDDVDTDEDTFSAGDKVSLRTAYYNNADEEYQWRGAKSKTFEFLSTGLAVDDLELSASESNTIISAIDGDGYGEIDIRSGKTTIEYTLQAIEDGSDLEESGVPVQVVVDDFDDAADLDLGFISMSGVPYKAVDNGRALVLTTKTNSDGQVKFSVTVDKADAEADYDIWYGYMDDDSDWTWAVDYLYAEYVDAEADEISTDSSVVAGSTVNLSYDVIDQFGEPISVDTDGKALKVQIADYADEDLLKQSATVVNGTAKFSFKNYVETGEVSSIEADLYSGASLGSSSIMSAETVNIYNPGATGAVELDEEDLTGNVTYDAFVTGDSADFADTVVAPNDAHSVVSGVVTDVNGADLPAAVVTVSAKGLQFLEAGTTDYFKDSITVVASEAGEFEVHVWAHEYNEDGIEIKVTSGGKTSVASLVTDWITADSFEVDALDDAPATYDEAAAENVVVKWNAPAHPAINKTYIVTSTVTDTWGNVLEDAVLDYEAVGALEVNGDSTADNKETNSSGKSTVYVRSVTDADGFAELSVDVTDVTMGDLVLDSSDLDVSITKEVLVGKNGAAKAGKYAGVVRAYAWNATGKTVQVYVSGKLVATRVATSSKYVFRVKGIKSGAKSVSVKVAGNTFFNEVVTVK